jgi:hypothetical protein
MKTPPNQQAFESAPSKRHFSTDNPRHLRAIHALDTRPMPREHLDSAAGCSNSPELVAELRRRGLEIPCQRVADLDRDGLPIRRGVYYFTEGDRRTIRRWLAKRQKGNIDPSLAGWIAFAGLCAALLLGLL